MTENEVMGDLRMPSHVWIELHADDSQARDVIVELDGGAMFTAVFVTLPYLERQMELTREFCKSVPDSSPSLFAALDTPHIVVADLSRENIEDTIDNLIAMGTFGSVFTQVTEDESDTETTTTNGNGRRATQEVAAVVLSDVLVVEE